jgi:predicted kinase
MAQKVIILRGLPASGKSTWAKQYVIDNPDYVRINKDELRLELLGGRWSRGAEASIVIPARNQRILEALHLGQSVIVDDTNLAPRHEADIRDLVAKNHRQYANPVEIEVKDFEISVEEAIERDSKRQGTACVGEKVIRGMASQFLKPAGPQIVKVEPCVGPNAIICDLDGTIALHEGVRNVYDGSKCHLDRVNIPVEFVLQACVGLEDTKIIYLSGREEKWRGQTLQFLCDNLLPYQDMLFMRPTGDSRKDSIVKQELFDQHVRGRFNVRFVLDDRNQVVEFWRAIGLTCLQVADGNF